MSGFIYLAINSEENGVLQKAEKSVQVSLKAVKHIAFVGIKLKEEQLVQLLNGVYFFKNVCYKNRLHVCKTKGHISELYYFGSISNIVSSCLGISTTLRERSSWKTNTMILHPILLWN